MYSRSADLIAQLDLLPHVEGGHYRRVHTAASPEGGRPPLSAIHYLLSAGQRGVWHVVDADEVWHFVEGDPMELTVYYPAEARFERRRLGRIEDGCSPMHVVPAHAWQSARPFGSYALMTCIVAPGFEFAGFRLLQDDDPLAEKLLAFSDEGRE